MLIPTLFVRDVTEEVAFLTEVLDFTLEFVMNEDDPFYAVLLRGADELHIARPGGLGQPGYGAVIVPCDDVDALFADFVARGLVLPDRPESPVHQGPLDQTWGTREVYIDDASGNTLIYQQR